MKWNPADYAKSSDVQLKWAQELQANLHLQGHESILDVGCGDGKISADFARLLPNGRVVAVDSSPEMIEYAIDDILPQPNWPEGDDLKANGLIAAIEQRSDLRVIKMSWASGIILATKL
jgi:trans-aconitate methyltransferase